MNGGQKTGWKSVLGGAVVLGFAAGALAAEPAAQSSMTFSEILKTGGWLMYVLGVMSIAALAFILYFFLVLRQDAVVPREFQRDLKDLLVAGRTDEARLASERNRSALAAVTATALSYVQRVDKTDPALLKDIIEGEGGRQAAIIQSQTQYLLDIAVVAPMVGLLGTVLGMLQSFNVVALDLAKAKPMLLAAGVSQALITTAAGLFVGIPAMLFYAYFRGRVAKLISMLEAGSAEFLTLVITREAPRTNGERRGAY